MPFFSCLKKPTSLEDLLKHKKVKEFKVQTPRSKVNMRVVIKCNCPFVFIVGPPGVGKKRQAHAIAKKFGYVHFDVPDLVKVEAMQNTPRGRHIKWILMKSRKFPEFLHLDLLKEAMAQTANRGIVAAGGVAGDGLPVPAAGGADVRGGGGARGAARAPLRGHPPAPQDHPPQLPGQRRENPVAPARAPHHVRPAPAAAAGRVRRPRGGGGAGGERGAGVPRAVQRDGALRLAQALQQPAHDAHAEGGGAAPPAPPVAGAALGADRLPGALPLQPLRPAGPRLGRRRRRRRQEPQGVRHRRPQPAGRPKRRGRRVGNAHTRSL